MMRVSGLLGRILRKKLAYLSLSRSLSRLWSSSPWDFRLDRVSGEVEREGGEGERDLDEECFGLFARTDGSGLRGAYRGKRVSLSTTSIYSYGCYGLHSFRVH